MELQQPIPRLQSQVFAHHRDSHSLSHTVFAVSHAEESTVERNNHFKVLDQSRAFDLKSDPSIEQQDSREDSGALLGADITFQREDHPHEPWQEQNFQEAKNFNSLQQQDTAKQKPNYKSFLTHAHQQPPLKELALLVVPPTKHSRQPGSLYGQNQDRSLLPPKRTGPSQFATHGATKPSLSKYLRKTRNNHGSGTMKTVRESRARISEDKQQLIVPSARVGRRTHLGGSGDFDESNSESISFVGVGNRKLTIASALPATVMRKASKCSTTRAGSSRGVSALGILGPTSTQVSSRGSSRNEVLAQDTGKFRGLKTSSYHKHCATISKLKLPSHVAQKSNAKKQQVMPTDFRSRVKSRKPEIPNLSVTIQKNQAAPEQQLDDETPKVLLIEDGDELCTRKVQTLHRSINSAKLGPMKGSLIAPQSARLHQGVLPHSFQGEHIYTKLPYTNPFRVKETETPLSAKPPETLYQKVLNRKKKGSVNSAIPKPAKKSFEAPHSALGALTARQDIPAPRSALSSKQGAKPLKKGFGHPVTMATLDSGIPSEVQTSCPMSGALGKACSAFGAADEQKAKIVKRNNFLRNEDFGMPPAELSDQASPSPNKEALNLQGKLEAEGEQFEEINYPMVDLVEDPFPAASTDPVPGNFHEGKVEDKPETKLGPQPELPRISQVSDESLREVPAEADQADPSLEKPKESFLNTPQTKRVQFELEVPTESASQKAKKCDLLNSKPEEAKLIASLHSPIVRNPPISLRKPAAGEATSYFSNQRDDLSPSGTLQKQENIQNLKSLTKAPDGPSVKKVSKVSTFNLSMGSGLKAPPKEGWGEEPIRFLGVPGANDQAELQAKKRDLHLLTCSKQPAMRNRGLAFSSFKTALAQSEYKEKPTKRMLIDPNENVRKPTLVQKLQARVSEQDMEIKKLRLLVESLREENGELRKLSNYVLIAKLQADLQGQE